MKRVLISAVLCALVLGTLVIAEDEKGYVAMFDGKTLENWKGNPKLWRVEDGIIVGETTAENPTKGNTFLIWQGGEPGEFDLKLEFKLRNGNSGVQYRSFMVEDKSNDWVMGGYQADMDEGNSYTGANYGEKFGGMLANRGQKTIFGADGKVKVVESVGNSKELAAFVKKGDWNEYHIVARGYTFTHIVNGHVMSIVTDENESHRRANGLIGFQIHAGPPMKVEFRNIRIKMSDAK